MHMQLTYFKCGGVSLGLCIHHLLADGYSALQFVNTWADMARGIDSTTTPFIDRTLLCARVSPQPIFPHIEYQPPPYTPPLSTALTFSIFPITTQQIKTLKVKSEQCYTSFEMLSAHVWRCACKARGLEFSQPTKLSIPVDGRSRLRPLLPLGFLGNVAFSATPVARAGDLVSKPTCYAARLIHEAVTRMEDEYLRSAIDYLQVNMAKLGGFMQTFGCPNLGISSWMRLPFGGADFGWGGPVYARPGINVDIEGLAQILSSTSNDGTLLLCITHFQNLCLILHVLRPLHLDTLEPFRIVIGIKHDGSTACRISLSVNPELCELPNGYLYILFIGASIFTVYKPPFDTAKNC